VVGTGSPDGASFAAATVSAQRMSEQEIVWCRHAGADLRAVVDAPTTTDRDRKLLLRAMISDKVVTR
jgi:hypothetical protein